MTFPNTPPDTEIDPRHEPGSDLPGDVPNETDIRARRRWTPTPLSPASAHRAPTRRASPSRSLRRRGGLRAG